MTSEARSCIVGVGIVVTSGSLWGVNGSILAQHARVVGYNPALGTIFPIFVTPTTVQVSF